MKIKLKNDGVSLRVVYIWIIIVALIISGLLFYSTFSMISNFENLTETTENQIALSKAAHELMDASDYLTERVQRFTVAGDRRFMDEYFTEAFETNRRENALSKLSGDESLAVALEQLKLAMNDSVALMDREYYAMRLVTEAKGYTDIPEVLQKVELNEIDKTLSSDDKMRRASEMVLDNEYYEKKNLIRIEMKESLYTIESITRNNENMALVDIQKEMNHMRIIIILQILIMIIVVWMTVSLGIRPILKAVDRIKADRPIQESGANEFRYLASAYNNLTIKLNEENDLLKHISQTDSLTGIRNRTALRNDYEAYLGHEVNVMMVDLDNFKMINDTYGHEEGDRVLNETGRLLSNTFNERFCYRYGGDEFLVIVPDMTEAEFRKKIRFVTESTPVLNTKDGQINIGYSIGYVHSVLNEIEDLRNFFLDADQKMYTNKRGKKNNNA